MWEVMTDYSWDQELWKGKEGGVGRGRRWSVRVGLTLLYCTVIECGLPRAGNEALGEVTTEGV